jgi:hypothetical protein
MIIDKIIDPQFDKLDTLSKFIYRKNLKAIITIFEITFLLSLLLAFVLFSINFYASISILILGLLISFFLLKQYFNIRKELSDFEKVLPSEVSSAQSFLSLDPYSFSKRLLDSSKTKMSRTIYSKMVDAPEILSFLKKTSEIFKYSLLLSSFFNFIYYRYRYNIVLHKLISDIITINSKVNSIKEEIQGKINGIFFETVFSVFAVMIVMPFVLKKLITNFLVDPHQITQHLHILAIVISTHLLLLPISYLIVTRNLKNFLLVEIAMAILSVLFYLFLLL